MKEIRLLAVCGSGTVSSTMVAQKSKDFLEERGYEVSCTEVNPLEAESMLSSQSFDIIVFTSPLVSVHDIPTINAVGLLTGINEDEVYSKLLDAVESN